MKALVFVILFQLHLQVFIGLFWEMQYTWVIKQCILMAGHTQAVSAEHTLSAITLGI